MENDSEHKPHNAIDDQETGNRYYLHPLTGERFLSVTTALSIITKPALLHWYGKQSAIRAVENLNRLNQAAHVKLCAKSDCGHCLTCLMAEISRAGTDERDAASSRGTRLHWVAQQYALTGQIVPHDADIEPHVKNFLDFVRVTEVEFEASEVTVLDRRLMVGGTLDGIARFGWLSKAYGDLIGKSILFDDKTSNNIYSRDGLQLAAYSNAETVLLPNGEELPLPDHDHDWALSIQINAKGWWLRRCPVGELAHQKFARAAQLWRDINEPDLDLVGRAMLKPRPKKAKR